MRKLTSIPTVIQIAQDVKCWLLADRATDVVPPRKKLLPAPDTFPTLQAANGSGRPRR